MSTKHETPTGSYTSLAQIKRANEARGHFWFTPETMAFFSTRIESGVLGGRYFVTSEQYDESAPRLFSVREAKPDGSIDTVGEFQSHETIEAALAAIEVS